MHYLQVDAVCCFVGFGLFYLVSEFGFVCLAVLICLLVGAWVTVVTFAVDGFLEF